MSIDGHSRVIVTRAGKHIEIQYMRYFNDRANIKKINTDEYIVLATGEVKPFGQKSNTRADNINSLRKTMKRGREKINANFFGKHGDHGGMNEKHITLTYADQTKDFQQIYIDMKEFIKRLRYRYGELEYIYQPEPHESGYFHIHLLLKFPKPFLLPNSDVAYIWGHGYTVTKGLQKIDNIGAYFSAYFTDCQMPEEGTDAYQSLCNAMSDGYQLHIKEVDGKRYAKGLRLYHYPPNVKMFRCSRGMKNPEKKKGIYKDIKKEYSLGDSEFTREYRFFLPDNAGSEKEQHIVYENYTIRNTGNIMT